MKLEWATRDQSQIDMAKAALADSAARNGQTIAGYRVTEFPDGPGQWNIGVKHWTIEGYTSQAELDQANASAHQSAP